MRNVYIIARREYLERVRSRAFLFMTIFIPLLMLGATVLPTLIAMRSSGETKHIVVAATDKPTEELIRRQITDPVGDDEGNGGIKDNQGVQQPYKIEIENDLSPASRAALSDKVKSRQLDGVVWASDDALAAGKVTF